MSSHNNQNHDPLGLKTIISGIIITVIGGLILAYFLQDARFAPKEPESRTEDVAVVSASDSSLTENDNELEITLAEESEEPVPTATPTVKPTPTNRPPTRTAVPTIEPHISITPKNLMPAETEIPDYFFVETELTTSNEYVAELRDNPTEYYQLIEDWEREVGYYKYFLNEEGCETTSGFRELAMQSIIHGSSSGAHLYWNWLYENKPSDIEILNEEFVEGIGEQATIRWTTSNDDCEPSNELLTVSISFQRYNVIGSIYLSGVRTTISEDDLQTLALRLAQLMDLKFLSNATQ